MDDQQNLLDYETIKGAVAGEKWVMERIQQSIALKLLEEISSFLLEEAEKRAKGETEADTI